MSNASTMVVASKYRLEVPQSITKGTWKKDGQKTLISENKIIPRIYVEQRNAHDNNELYIIDEEATKKMLKDREANVKKQAEKKEQEKVSNVDLAQALIKEVVSKSETKKEEPKAEPKKKVAEPEAEIPNKKDEDKIMHTLTKADIKEYDELKLGGYKVGDEVELNAEGEIIIQE